MSHKPKPAPADPPDKVVLQFPETSGKRLKDAEGDQEQENPCKEFKEVCAAGRIKYICEQACTARKKIKHSYLLKSWGARNMTPRPVHHLIELRTFLKMVKPTLTAATPTNREQRGLLVAMSHTRDTAEVIEVPAELSRLAMVTVS